MARMAEQAYGEIRDRILERQLLPGEWLREEDLAATIGVSRTPVREALGKLHGEGLVVLTPNRGAQVTEWAEQDLNELFSLRALLEGFGARLAASKITPDQLVELESLADQMEGEVASSASPQRLAPVHRTFHLLVATAAANRRLQVVISSVTQLAWLQRTLERYGPEYMNRSTTQHREIIAALRAGNPDWAQSIMVAHVLGARDIFTADIDSGPSGS